MSTTANLNTAAQRRHNVRNSIHTFLLVTLTAALMGLIAYSVLGITGLVIAAVFGAVAMMSLGKMSPQMVLNLYKARPLSETEAPELHQIMRELTAAADLPAMPRLFYVQTKMLNAFAVGSREDSAIAVTDGLLRTMNLRQINGILAHEVSHIVSGDLKVMGMADVLNRITSFMSTLGLIGIPLIFGTGVNIPLLGPLLLIFAPTLGGLLQLALSRSREYDADLDGATLTGDPEGLASALQLLENRQKGIWEGLALPGSRLPQPSMLRTHPKTEDRIARLLALRQHVREQIVVQSEKPARTSVVPPVRDPRIHWLRMGIYY
jgi:heat shock protein HtpX